MKKLNRIYRSFLCLLAAAILSGTATAHDIIFCGELIPVNNDFVANKLMNVIRGQIPNVNLASLRQRALLNFPYVESCLRKAGIPEDFKYLPIVESGFMNLTSRVGAKGFWQLMPATAQQQGLIINGQVDEREDIVKSTIAACKVLSSFYNAILKRQQVASWILTAAAYNFGPGNVFKAISNQGTKDYFSLNLNPETAVYVYKIIAVKELFEFPELYMKNFGYNVFSAANSNQNWKNAAANSAVFSDITVKVGKQHKALSKPHKDVYVQAHIKGKYSGFKDGDLVAIEIDNDLVVQGGFTRKGSVIKGQGWIVDGRVVVDLGYGHDIILYDSNVKKGLEMSSLKKGEPVLLKNEIYDDQSQW